MYITKENETIGYVEFDWVLNNWWAPGTQRKYFKPKNLIFFSSSSA